MNLCIRKQVAPFLLCGVLLLPRITLAQSYKKEVHAGKPDCIVKYNDGKCTVLNGTIGWDSCLGGANPTKMREYYTHKLGDTKFTPVLCGDKDAFLQVDCDKSCKAIAKKNYAGGRCTAVKINCPGGANNANSAKCECDKGGNRWEDFPNKGQDDIIAFVTEGVYPGNFGGRASADAICQTAAATAGLLGDFRALLSDAGGIPFDLSQSIGFFGGSVIDTVQPSGTVIQDTTDLLVSGGALLASLSRSENGTLLDGVNVWTGSNSDGTEAQTCSGWTSGSSSQSGTIGLTGQTSSAWLSSGSLTCDSTAHLYCIRSREGSEIEDIATPTPSSTPSPDPTATPIATVSPVPTPIGSL